MLLFGLLLLTSALAGQRHGTQAESNLSSKFQYSSNKEQNGVQDPQHERIITVSTNGSIHSPRFPHTYPRNMVLVWRLVAVEENVWIQLTFDERFGLEDPEDDICKYDFVEVEEPSDGTILGRWCGSGTVPGKQISKGNQIRIRFVSDEYFPSEPGFCIHYNIVMPQFTEAVSPSVLPPSALPLDLLNNAVTAFSTLEDLIRYLEPDRWQLDLEDLYRPTWQLLGKAFVFGRKSRVVDLNLLKEEVVSWLNAVVETVPAVSTTAMSVSASRVKSLKNTMRALLRKLIHPENNLHSNKGLQALEEKMEEKRSFSAPQVTSYK
uniref:CUB domain-containing protein n=1 Tax=Felis catus TaxID=9685 RepID=A0ABI7X1N1_FELCA